MSANIRKNFLVSLVVLILYVFFCNLSFAINLNNSLADKNSNDSKSFVVVIDPAHGGRDTGSKGVNLREKTFSLKIAKLLKNEISR